MEPIETLPADAKDMHAFFLKETDRGAAVLAGSYAENLLGLYLQSFMVDRSVAEKMFGAHGSLATFSQRIDFAKGFGHLDAKTCADLHLVRKIRNYFAHHPKSASFTESPVKEWSAVLSTANITAEQAAFTGVTEPRLPYLIAVMNLILAFNVKTYGYGNPEAA